MIVTDDGDIAKKLRIMRLHGLSNDAWKRFTSKKLRILAILPGYKYNSTDMNAVLGLVQLKKLEGLLARREQIAEQTLRSRRAPFPRSNWSTVRCLATRVTRCICMW